MLARALLGINQSQRRVRDYVATFETPWRLRLELRATSLGLRLSIPPPGDVASISKANRTIRISTEFRGYVWDVLNQFDIFFDLVDPKEERGNLVVDFSKPAEHVLRSSRVPFYFVSYAENDAASELYLELAGLEPGHVVFDGGAYCGASAYAFSKAVGPHGKVLAFEPDEKNFGALVRNVARHSLDNVIPLKMGLWSSTTTVSFHAHGNMGSSIVEGAAPAPNVHSIKVTSLADAFAQHGLERLDFVKLDIEGAEVEALRAAHEFLRARRPRIVVESHFVKGRLTTDDLRDIFREIGFRSQILLEFAESPYHLVYAWPDGTSARRFP